MPSMARRMRWKALLSPTIQASNRSIHPANKTKRKPLTFYDCFADYTSSVAYRRQLPLRGEALNGAGRQRRNETADIVQNFYCYTGTPSGFFKPSPGGEGAEHGEADEVESLVVTYYTGEQPFHSSSEQNKEKTADFLRLLRRLHLISRLSAPASPQRGSPESGKAGCL